MTSNFVDVEVIRVIDGDTAIVDLGEEYPEILRFMSVRVSGIDTPELKAKRVCEKKDAKRAKEALDRLIGQSFVNLLFCSGDKYWRLNCSIMVGDNDVSQYMLQNGFAVGYSGSTKLKWGCRK